MKTASSPLPYELVSREDLSEGMIARMHELMETCYDHVSSDRFREDLARKDWILVLPDPAGRIQGFSTLALNPCGLEESGYDVLYSGDTVIHPEYWGGQSLVRGFFDTAGSILSNRGKPLFWYLLSKGHRTYMYLPLFFKRYFPAVEQSREFPMGSSLAAFFSERLFPGNWQPDRGVLHFSERHGQVNEALAEDTRSRAGHPQVDFFMERNPGFAEGDELVCVAELSPENLRRPSTRLLMETGMRGALSGKEEICME
jgi:hypothetical protein